MNFMSSPQDSSLSPASPPPRRQRKKLIIVLILLGALAGLAWWRLQPNHFPTKAEVLHLDSLPDDFPIFYFEPQGDVPKAVILIGSGDGGWSYWEEKVCVHLASRGCAVVGWDTRQFAKHPYDQAILAKGFAAATAKAKEELADKHAGLEVAKLPVIYGGWSTGAEQSLPAAVSEFRDPALAGLLLVAPGGRGRYGLTDSDILGIPPSGPDTWALTDFADRLKPVRILQIHAGLDPLDDIKWIEQHKGDHKLIVQHRTLHDFHNAGVDFMKTLDEALAWLVP